MKQKVTFELLQPLMCGGIRIAENFLESEVFIRGSVLRAAFANTILLECPLADQVTADGKHNYITLKEPDGRCLHCMHRAVCEAFGDMTFTYAYPENCIPAPLTAKQCKKCGTLHPVKDILVEDVGLKCEMHGEDAASSRMENLKGMIRMDEEKVDKVKVNMTLSTHTAINYHSHTAYDGSLYSVRAIKKGQKFTAVIDDCNTEMLRIGDVIYAGKYSSCGFGKLRIAYLESIQEVSAAEIRDRIEQFNHRFRTKNLVSIFFLSDAFPLDSMESDKVLTNEEYLAYWEKSLFGDAALPFSVKKIFTEVQLYSGYNTAKAWNHWKSERPDPMILKGTSLLLEIHENCREQAIELLSTLQKNGIGRQTENGFGQIEICHPIHFKGVNHHE